MPVYTRGVLRDNLVYVKVSVAANAYYGFTTKNFDDIPTVTATDMTHVGHLKADQVGANSLKFLRAQSPKPPRVRKVLNAFATASQQIGISTFCAVDSIAEAEGNGWKVVKRGTPVGLRRGRMTSGISELSDGSYYVHPINTIDYDNHAAILGLKPLNSINTPAERGRLVRGSTRPYPGRAQLKLPSGGSVSSFFSSDKEAQLLEANWEILSTEYV